MKAIVLTSILAAFLSISNLSAANPNVKVYSNIETTEDGCVKEFISYNEKTSKVIDKSVYQYDASGNMQNKTIYTWSNETGWVSVKKYDYSYNGEGSIEYMTFTEWDNKAGNWSSEKELMAHIYDNEGNLIGVEKTKIDNSYIAQK